MKIMCLVQDPNKLSYIKDILSKHKPRFQKKKKQLINQFLYTIKFSTPIHSPQLSDVINISLYITATHPHSGLFR